MVINLKRAPRAALALALAAPSAALSHLSAPPAQPIPAAAPARLTTAGPPLMSRFSPLSTPHSGRCPEPLSGREPRDAVEREAVLMGTRMRVTVRGPDRQAALEATETAFREVARVEADLSSWRSDSEIGRLNTAPVGRRVELSEEVDADLREARAWTTRSRGAFDPVIGALIDAWDLRGYGRLPSREELETARAASGWRALEVEGRTRWARRDGRAWVSSGGFGKGVALREAARALADAGIESVVLDLGGQLSGISADGCAAWPVGVAHPARRTVPVALLRLGSGRSLATSGSSERFVEVKGERYGHIIDPRSGRPAEAWGSVTVLAEDPLVADIASTAAYVLGPCEGLAWVGSQDGISALVLRIREDGRLEADWSESLAPGLIELDSAWVVSAGPGTMTCAGE